VLSRFSDSASCEYGTSQCQVAGVRLAAALLLTLDTRPVGDPDRGPWPAWLILTCLGLAATVVAVGGWAALAIRRRRRLGSVRTAPG
jgi:hypothetical protein